jgi:DNA-binding winged helix-turn-helix (wHTH) protein/TolB-like protein/Tfp pilus assembly protein PilF
MRLNTKSFYEFGPFRLDPEEHLLLRGDEPLPLAPKAFELLIFLVQNPGRLLTKDQIMRAVWRDSFVEEANLTVWISVLRKTLAEADGLPRYIETVPKMGYRFTADVKAGTALEQAEVQSTGTTPISTLEASAVAESNTQGVGTATVLPEIEVASAADVKVLSRLISQGAPWASAWRKRVAIPLLVVSVVLLVLFGYLAISRIREASHKTPPLRTLAVLPFRNLQPSARDDFLGYSLADAVITKMGYVSSLSVRPSTAIERYRNQTIDSRKVASDLNVDTLLTANYVREGDNLRITYQLIEAKSDKIIGRGTIDVKYDKLLHVQDSVAQEIINVLELNLTPAEAERIKPDKPVDPLAYEYYLRGVDLHSRHEFPMAIQMLEKSRDIDPNYALTWTYLGASYNSAAAFQFGGREQYNKARAAYEKALSLQPAQLEARMFLANLLIDTGNVEQAVPLLRDGLKTNPNQAAIHWELGYAYRFAGMLQESVEECEKAREIDPLVKANGSMLNAYLYLGEYDKFLKSLPDDNNSSFVVFYRGLAEYYKKDWDQAAKDFDRANALDPTLYTQTGKAFSYAITHRNSEGLEILHDLESKIQQRGVGDPEATYKIAQAYSSLGDKASALRVLRSSVEGGFFSYPYIANDPLLDTVRSEPEFTEILNAARKRHEEFKAKFS